MASLVISDRSRDVRAADEVGALARRAAGGTFWVMLAFAVQRLLGLATSLILARLLSPADFGLVSFALILINAFQLLQDLGVPDAIIYGQRDPRATAGTALTINVAAAFLLFVLTGLCSPILAEIGHNQAIAPVATLLGLGLVFISLGSVQRALLQKDLAFRRKFLPDVVPFAVSGLLSIALALLGFGAWSLVFGYLVRGVATSLLLWSLSAIRPWPRFHPGIARELLRYGRHVSFGALIGFVLNNVDYFLIGHVLGSAQLGLYTMAFMVAMLPSTAISQLVGMVSFPTYTRLRCDRRLIVQFYHDILTVVCALTIPAGVVLFVCAPVFVNILFGHKWEDTAEPLRVLSVLGILRSITTTFGPLYKALGRPDIVWKGSLLRLLVIVPAILYGLGYGIKGVAVAQVLVVGCSFPFGIVVLSRAMGVPVAQQGRVILPQLAAAAVMGLVVAVGTLEPGLGAASAGPLGSALLAAAATAVYAAALVRLNPRIAVIGRSLLRSLRSSAA